VIQCIKPSYSYNCKGLAAIWGGRGPLIGFSPEKSGL